MNSFKSLWKALFWNIRQEIEKSAMLLREEVQKRRQEEAWSRGLLEAAPDAMVIVDAEGRIVQVNAQAEKIFGYPRSELIGQRVEILVPKRLQVDHAVQRARYHEDPVTRPMWTGLDIYAQRKDSTTFPVEISLSPMNTDQQTFVTAAIRDVTMQRALQQELRVKNNQLDRRVQELAHLNKELEAFSYSVSHDLRAPLRGIDGFSRMVLERQGDRLDPQGMEQLQRVRASAKKMGVLIDDLLSLARLSRTELHWKKVDFSAMAANLLREIQQNEPSRRAHCVVAPNLFVEGDERLLKIVLENLLVNAWKFTSKCAETSIEVGAETKENELTFFVKDNGVGFDMANASQLFQAFQRFHSEEEYPGSGIGLATVQRIVHRHGGRIWAEAKPNEGAKFEFVLGRPT